MSVIVNGMEMPKNCEVCDIKSWDNDGYVCPFSGVMTLNIGRQGSCPLGEIIRCKDCKHWREGTTYTYCDKLFRMGVLDIYDYMTTDDDFCSYAERKENRE